MSASHIQPFYLAAHGAQVPRHPLKDFGLEKVQQTAAKLSGVQEAMVNHAVSDLVGTPLSEDRFREIAGLFGSMGESLAIAVAVQSEIFLHRIWEESGERPKEMEVAERFFVEQLLQIQVSISHRFINLVARLLASRCDWRKLAPTRFEQLATTPWSDDREAWLNFGKPVTASLLSWAHKIDHAAPGEICKAANDLAISTEWDALDACRGEDFHRRRPNSSVIRGVDDKSGYQIEVQDLEGRTVGRATQGQFNRYSAGDAILDERTATADNYLIVLLPALETLCELTPRAIEPATYGSHIVRSDGGYTKRIGEWSDASCSCCQTRLENQV